uniref:CSON010534 protein n=1 Tax=Culicoides sonorensis TaxID=179676 RepID=A0A336LPL9_CULSO
MDGLLPDDQELCERKEDWENLLKKFATTKDTEELELDKISDVLDGSFGSDSTEKENAPEAVEVEPSPSFEKKEESSRALTNQLKLAVKAREVSWKEKGLNFTFDKVSEWLKSSCYNHQKVKVNPKTGSQTVEQTHHQKMHVKRKYRNNKDNSRQRKRPVDADDFSSSKSISDDTDMSDNSSNTSVDTAKYIRANQNHRTKKVTKTIIKKYIVTSEHVNHHRHLKATAYRRSSLPLRAINSVPSEDSPSKKKHRKTRHELNKRRRSSRRITSEYSSSSNSESNSDIDLCERQKRKLPLPRLKPILSEPINTQSSENKANIKNNNSTWISNKDIEKISTSKPKVILQKLSEETLKIHNSPETPRPISNKTALNNINQEGKESRKLNESVTSNHSKSSSNFNMSRKSWAHLPKKVVIYHPNLNTTNDETVTITNKHFEEAIGTEATKEILQTINYEKVVNASSQVILELPDEESDNHSSDSEIDALDIVNNKQVPKLSIVPVDDK